MRKYVPVSVSVADMQSGSVHIQCCLPPSAECLHTGAEEAVSLATRSGLGSRMPQAQDVLPAEQLAQDRGSWSSRQPWAGQGREVLAAGQEPLCFRVAMVSLPASGVSIRGRPPWLSLRPNAVPTSGAAWLSAFPWFCQPPATSYQIAFLLRQQSYFLLLDKSHWNVAANVPGPFQTVALKKKKVYTAPTAILQFCDLHLATISRVHHSLMNPNRRRGIRVRKLLPQ